MANIAQLIVAALGKPTAPARPSRKLGRLYGRQLASLPAGAFCRGALHLFGEGLEELDPCLEAWHWLLPEGTKGTVVGKNLFGALLVLTEQADRPFWILDPLTLRFYPAPKGLFTERFDLAELPLFFTRGVFGTAPRSDQMLAAHFADGLHGAGRLSTWSVVAYYQDHKIATALKKKVKNAKPPSATTQVPRPSAFPDVAMLLALTCEPDDDDDEDEDQDRDAPSSSPRDEARAEKLLLRTAYRPDYADGDSDQPVTKLGGAPWLGGEAQAPPCGTCGTPLAFVAQLQLAKLPAMAGKGLVQLFVCERGSCTPIFDPAANVVRLVQAKGPSIASKPRKRDAKRDIAYAPDRPVLVKRWKPVDDFPFSGDADHEAIVAAHEDLAAAFESIDSALETEPGDKLAGWPYWHEVVGTLPPCPTCRKPTRLLLQLDYGKSSVLPDGQGIALVSQCPTHAEQVQVTWAT